jgi:hypothetical protein
MKRCRAGNMVIELADYRDSALSVVSLTVQRKQPE